MPKTLIIGGGLSGLALADMLEAQGHDYLLIEARDRFGGRIKTERHGAGTYDLGPAWFWPDQPRIAALIERSNLTRFDQFSTGDVSFEDEHGRVQRGRGFASMQGSWRLEGGLERLTTALADGLPKDRKILQSQAVKLSYSDDRITVELASGDSVTANRVVFALPPRLAATLSFSPELPYAAMDEMARIPTRMAGQAKAVAVYDTAFWRDAGLSGDAQSRRGPMVEIHDASSREGSPPALFGFIGLPPNGRQDVHSLRQHIVAQLVRLFGPNATNPSAVFIKDWAFDPFTSTEVDQAPLYAHPAYGLPAAMQSLWDNRLIFAGTEVAPQFGGFIERALEAAENAFEILSAHHA